MTDAPGPRIVSLLPAATEIVYALQAGNEVVGVSHECDHPEAVKRLPRVSRARLEARGGSARIDAQVKAIRAKGESLFELDGAALKRLRPDLILTQVKCDVCAITPGEVEEAVAGLTPQPTVVSLDAQSLEGVLDDIRDLGKVLGREEEAKLLLFRMWRMTKEIRRQVKDLEPPRVAVIDWVDPLMFAGNWIPELARIANADYTLVQPGKPSRWGSWEELEEYEPDAILVAPCGRGVEETKREFAAVAKGHRDELQALESGRVFVADGHEFFNRPGPRLLYSAALMARAFHDKDVPPLPPVLESRLARLDGDGTRPQRS